MRHARWGFAVKAAGAALAIALVLSACGGDGDEPPPAATAASEATAAAAADGAPTDVPRLHIGGVLPETGSLAFNGVPIIAAVRLAVEDVNAQGGNVTFTLADDGTNPAMGLEAARRMLAEGAQVIVGAGSSAVSQAIIQTLFDEQTPQCTASNTSPAFTNQPNATYFFRTIAPDNLMAPVIADVVVSLGASRVAIIGRADAWGNALEALLLEELEQLGADTFSVLYDPETTSFSAEVTAVANYNPDMVINLGFSSDGSATVRLLLEHGIGPERQFAATGLYTPTLWQQVEATNPAVLDGMYGISQLAQIEGDFSERLRAVAGDYLAYGPEGYDCVILLALAARIAGDPSDGVALMEAINGLTQGGVECGSYAECAALIDAGEDIDYQGVSGPINLDPQGDPTVGVYTIHRWENGGNSVVIDQVTLNTLEE